MAKKSFLNKKELVPTLVNAGIRGAAAYGSKAFISPMVGKVLPAGIQPYKGLLIASVGVLGEVMLKDQKLKAVAQGISTQGIMDVAEGFIGSKLQGLGAAGSNTETRSFENQVDWEALAKEVENEFPGIKGNETHETQPGDKTILEAEDTALKLA